MPFCRTLYKKFDENAYGIFGGNGCCETERRAGGSCRQFVKAVLQIALLFWLLEFLKILPSHSNSRTGRPGKVDSSHGWRVSAGCVSRQYSFAESLETFTVKTSAGKTPPIADHRQEIPPLSLFMSGAIQNAARHFDQTLPLRGQAGTFFQR